MLAALNVLGDVATIVTAAVAVIAWTHFKLMKRKKQLRLEQHLRKEADWTSGPGPEGAQSLPQLVAALGMSESDTMNAAFDSNVIRRLTQVRGTDGLTVDVMLAYDDAPPRRF